MKKLFYGLRVFFISYEFLLIVISFIILNNFSDKITKIAQEITFNGELVLTIIVISSIGFILSKLRSFLFPSSKLCLQKYPDYWRIKIHFFVTIIYTIIFSFLVSYTTLFGIRIDNAVTLLSVLTGLIGLIIVALSVYIAEITLNEIVNKNE